MRNDVIYLDNNASTDPDPEVVDAVSTAFRDLIGNPSSTHTLGTRAAAAIELARERVSALISCPPRAVVFTSGATEADSLAIRGLWEATRLRGVRRDTIVVGATEHPAVLEAAHSLEGAGARVHLAPVDGHGVIDLTAFQELVDERVLLVSVMAANNETGTLAPLQSVIEIAKEAGAYVHCDATQFVGRVSLDMMALDLDLLVLSGHKMHGPKGVGALVVRHNVPITPQIHGGGHERGLRSGTLNTPGIVGLGVAAELAARRFGEAGSIAVLRDLLHRHLSDRLAGVSLNGHPTQCLPNTLNLRFAGADGDAVMASMPRIACSSGSACSSAVPSPSHVLLAMGLDHRAAEESLRFSLSRTTTPGDIGVAVEDIVGAVEFVRHASAMERN